MIAKNQNTRLSGGNFMKKSTRILFILVSILLVCTTAFTFAGCNHKQNTTPTEVIKPTDNDNEGWFTIEVVSKYNVAAMIQPEGTQVISKPEPDKLYLSGDEDAFKLTVAYVYEAIKESNTQIYLPVLGIGEDSVAAVTGLTPITHIDYDKLYPTGEDMVVNIIYKSARKVYEATISYENNGQIYVAFVDRTDLYLPLM